MTIANVSETKKNDSSSKVEATESHNFWQGKTPCWEMSDCPKGIKLDCPAFRWQYLPCWQIEGTLRKVFDYEQGGDGTAACRLCEVYKNWGDGEAIEIKLLLKDFRSVPETVLK